MTPQEQQLLQDLTQKINSTTLPDKDGEAEQFLNQSLGRNPDAVYILAQTVLVQNYALTQAQTQLDQMKQQLAQQQQAAPQKHGSFLGNLLGMNDAAPPPPPPPPQNQYAPVNYAPPPSYGGPQYAQPPMQYGSPMGVQQGGGFLQSAMRTATGVAAGALAFEGIESLMHGFEHHAGYGSGLGGFGGGGLDGGQPREAIINNYYGDDRGEHEHGFGDRLEASRDNDNLSPDLDDRRDRGGRDFAGSGNDDNSSFADSDESVDDGSSSNDSSSYDSDDSGSFDPGGDDSSF